LVLPGYSEDTPAGEMAVERNTSATPYIYSSLFGNVFVTDPHWLRRPQPRFLPSPLGCNGSDVGDGGAVARGIDSEIRRVFPYAWTQIFSNWQQQVLTARDIQFEFGRVSLSVQ
jgi:hypothetical protein